MRDDTIIPVPEDERIATLDIVRGVAVMGILAMNIIVFAMPLPADANPLAYGTRSTADFVSWLVDFILVGGRMRGLFSFLFGASMLLVILRADDRMEPSANIHFRRMAWLLWFGLAHYYFIWSGDILSLYAPVGMAAWFFCYLPVRTLILFGIAMIAVETLVLGEMTFDAYRLSVAAAAPDASAETLLNWHAVAKGMAVPDAADLAKMLAQYRGSYVDITLHRLTGQTFGPLHSLLVFGWETLGYMLLGMAALKSGFLGGHWTSRQYAIVAGVGFLVSVPLYAVLALLLYRSNFSVPALFAFGLTATAPLRPIMVVAYAALIILVTRNGGALVQRIAAAGRAAFTNYLGTSIVMTTLFYGYGFGLFGTMTRSELWLVVIPMWAVMLLWSKPWLERYRYGPFEWLWRSLARGRLQPMRRGIAPQS